MSGGVKMINFFISDDNGKITKTTSFEKGCWIDVVEPTIEDKRWLQDSLNISPEFVRSAFDDEETSHIDYDDETNQILVIVDCPYEEDENEKDSKSIKQYDTHPLSFVLSPDGDYILTLSQKKNNSIADFANGRERNCFTQKRMQFMLKIILKLTKRYMTCLRIINRQIRQSEKKLRNTMSNSALMGMLGLEKSLVYFSTSLKGLESTVFKIGNGKVMPLWEADGELIDDVKIEVRQAVEMCGIYTDILNSITDTFSSVINNNLNHTMRTLTLVTLIMAVPTMIFSFYGMNVIGLPFAEFWWIPLIIAAVLITVVIVILKKTKFLH